MKKIFIGVLFTTLFLSSFSQVLLLSSEDEIFDKQISTNYFYGECTELYDSVAMAIALENLVANANDTSILKKDVVYYYYVSEVGGIKYYHVYTFVEKNINKPQTPVPQQTIFNGTDVEMSSNQQLSSTSSVQDTPMISDSMTPFHIEDTREVQLHIEQTKWKREAIDYLIKAGDLQSVIERLERMILTKKIAAYGRYQDCKDKAIVCWAVFDTQNRLVAILGDGYQTRYNYKTGETNELDDYTNSSYKVLWFTFDD